MPLTRPEPFLLTPPPAMNSDAESFRFVALTMDWIGKATAYMDWLEAPVYPEVMLTRQDRSWLERVMEQISQSTGIPISQSRNLSLVGRMLHIVQDSYYWTATRQGFLQMVSFSWAKTWQWLEEQRDCDKAAQAFKSHLVENYGFNGIGVVIDYEGSHAYNIVPFTDRSWALVDAELGGEESPTIKFVQPHEAPYIFQSGLILL